MLVVLMLIIFVLGYALIAFEHRFQINKTATAIFLGVILWILYMLGADQFVPQHNAVGFQQYLTEHQEIKDLPLLEQVRDYIVNVSVIEHIGDISEIIFFLMGAMAIVELVDRHGGFNFVNKSITTRKSIKLLWIMSLMTFFLSAVLDNMTTAIVMVMVLRKLVSSQQERWIFASMIILASNAGGAFSPIGDVTTIMLWINGNISSLHTIQHLFLPSFVSMLVPLIILSFSLKGGSVEATTDTEEETLNMAITKHERVVIFCLGVGGLMFVPFFRSLTGLPPFIGILGVLSVLWLYTEIIYGRMKNIEESDKYRVSKVIRNIDMPTILFFLGILMAVAALQEVGVLAAFANYLDSTLKNVYLIDTLIGMLSSIVDNVPLVAAAMGMYPIELAPETAFMSNFVADGHFWQLLAYCAGIGGSLLIIGSAAGVVVMGLEKIQFGWYLKKMTFVALIGYLSGIGVYYLQTLL